MKGRGDRRNDGRRSHKGGNSEDCRGGRSGNGGVDGRLQRGRVTLELRETHNPDQKQPPIPTLRSRPLGRDGSKETSPLSSNSPQQPTLTHASIGVRGGQACHGLQGGKQQGAARTNNNCERMKAKPNQTTIVKREGRD